MRTVRDCMNALQQKQISSVELTQHYLKQIEQHNALNAFISVDEEYALTQAQAADCQLGSAQATPLTGIPMAHKDLFCTDHFPTTCGSKMLANFKSPYTATLVKRLQQAGSVLLGKTNMDEFAMGSSNEYSFFGPVHNPWDHKRSPGGSSGGSAAAVTAGLVPYATASDTGGSIRQPAAWCGISGLKPTYGLVSRFGMVAFASSLDQAGPMARSADDLALILQAMAAHDPNDSTSAQQSIPDYSAHLNDSIKGVTIGVPRYYLSDQVDASIADAMQSAISEFTRAGAIISEIDFQHQALWVPCYYVIACAEASSNLSRYDGIRFGHQSSHQSTLRELITASRNEGFGTEVKRRILTGTYVLSAGYYADYYLQALKIRRLIKNEFQSMLKQVDVILSPTTPSTATLLGQHTHNPVQHYLADVFTVAANLAGIPALSIPAGFDQGLPIGIQLMGNDFHEAKLLNIAHQFQQASDWHTKTPTLEVKR